MAKTANFCRIFWKNCAGSLDKLHVFWYTPSAVSYTHLDVYKRQAEADVRDVVGAGDAAGEGLTLKRLHGHDAHIVGCLLYTSISLSMKALLNNDAE